MHKLQREEEAKQREKEAKQREKEAKQREEEASKNRISPSEIDVLDLQLPGQEVSWYVGDYPWGFDFKGYRLTGRIRNRSAYTLNSITLFVRLYEKEDSPDILGEKTVLFNVNIPPHQTRAIGENILIDSLPKLENYALKYDVIEIRGK